MFDPFSHKKTPPPPKDGIVAWLIVIALAALALYAVNKAIRYSVLAVYAPETANSTSDAPSD